MADPVFDPASNPFSQGDDFPTTDPLVTLPGGVSAVEPDYGYQVSVGHETLVTTSWSGKEKRSAKGPARRKWRVAFENLTPTEADTLWNHFLAQEGRRYSFTYYDYLSGEAFTVRYDMEAMTRETFLYQAEKASIELIEVL